MLDNPGNSEPDSDSIGVPAWPNCVNDSNCKCMSLLAILGYGGGEDVLYVTDDAQ